MSYYPTPTIQQYIPTYVVRSDFLPTAVVHQGSNPTTAELVHL